MSSGPEVVREPLCKSADGRHPAISLVPASDVAVAYVADLTDPVVFATQPELDIVALNWRWPAGDWSGWSCFDHVMRPALLAAGNRMVGEILVFAATDDGRMYTRTLRLGKVWSDWASLLTPLPGALVSDMVVSGARSRVTRLYAASGGSVFVRSQRRLGDEAHFDAWLWLGTPAAQRLAVEMLEDGVERVFALDDHGALFAAVFRTESEPTETRAVVWEQLWTGPVLADIAAMRTPGGSGQLLGIDTDGALWLAESTKHVSWQSVPLTVPRRFKAIAATGRELEAYATDAEGKVLGSTPPWSDWYELP